MAHYKAGDKKVTDAQSGVAGEFPRAGKGTSSYPEQQHNRHAVNKDRGKQHASARDNLK
ncbi:hypothetical protein [Rhizobium gallicum]|uniref:hypothetical protein n=1 Tax=Rhizobium gallicum TaxID=56730 RepID=UPI001CC242F5|nr:hypothetical protein [Rhizobium gallicum]